MYTWLNKPSVLVLNISNKPIREKKTYKSLSSDRLEKIPDGSCSILFLEIDLQERVFQQIFMTHMINDIKQPHQNPF